MTSVKRQKGWRMSCDVGEAEAEPHPPTLTSLHLHHKLILQPFCCFTYVTAHSTALPLLHLHHRHFTYVTAHSPTLTSLHLRHSSFSNPSFAPPTSQALHLRHLASRPCSSDPMMVRQTYSAHSPTFPSLHLRHSSFSNPYVALPTS